MRNIALKLMYNGTAYHGWQMQRTGPCAGSGAGQRLYSGA